MLKLFSDGAASPNDSLAGVGLVVLSEGLHEQISIPLQPTKDNHLAELHAFLEAVNWVIKANRADEYCLFHTDSQLVAQAIKKNKIKKLDYQPVFEEIVKALNHLSLYDVKWVPEKENKGADNLAKQALAKQ